MYSPPEEKNKNDLLGVTIAINKNFKLKISELMKETEKLNQDLTNLKSQLYIAENRFNDRKQDHERAIQNLEQDHQRIVKNLEQDHERIVKDKDSEITKLKKKSWGAKAAPYLACTLSCVLIFVVMRIYFTLYPLKDDPIVI